MRYRCLSTTRQRMYFLIFYLSGIVFPCVLKSQSIIQLEARDDNFFAYPGNFQYLDVLKNDDYGECSQTTVNLTVPSMITSKGTAVVIPATNRIYYMPNAGITGGQDVFTYTIECGGNISTATVYVNISEQLDFMEIDKCFVTRPATIWDIEKKAQSNAIIHPLATPFVGDLDGDGLPEVVVPNYMPAGFTSYSNGSDTILIFNHDLTLKNKFPTPLLPTYPNMPILIADVDNDGQGEIVVCTSHNEGGEDMYRVVCYTESGVRKWTSEVPFFTTDQRANGVYNTDASIAPVIADMNGDGYGEILAYDKIFAAESGKLLATLPDGGRARGNVGGPTTFVYMPVLADVDNDGMLEVVAGNTTYKVSITNREGTAGNSASILAQVNLDDGFTSVADIDGDGSPDVIVTLRSPARMYVWDGATPNMIGSLQTSGSSASSTVSRAFIGDITGNGVPDIAFTYVNGMVAYTYDRSTDTFSQLWQKPTTDSSGCTTMSMFDFDQNGEAELIYRDETHLRIIDKDGNNIVEIDCHSGTHAEYPVIVDLDGDGHADILVSGANQYENRSSTTYLMHYGSITPNQWANCRQVWNQHGFNPVYIRDDMSLVRFPVNPATAFYEAQTGNVNHPYNNFLQQSTKLNQEGTPLHDGPNLYFDSSRQSILEMDTSDNLKITIHINNDGDASYTGNLRISTYVYDTSVNPAQEYKIFVHNETVNILPLSTDPNPTVITYTINNFSLVEPPQYDRWEIRLNWEDNIYPIDMEECRYSDNIDNNLALAGGEHVMCEGETERVYAYPENTYWYIWYDELTGGTKLGEGDYCDLYKNADPVQYYYLEIYDLATKSNRLSSVREPVSLYLAPDSLVWTGAGSNSNWHDAANWKNPVPLHLYDGANIPRACTNVLLPEHIDNYPDLTTGKTAYKTYDKAACSNITFAHGGELVRQDLLTYQRAYAELTLESNRWYMVSAPLRDLYPGDYYVADPNPVEDEVFVYTRLFSRSNPQTKFYVSGDWTGAFNKPNYLLGAGLGFSVWVDDKQDDPDIHTPFTFSFPKYDEAYYVHDNEGNPVIYHPFDRTNHHRFIYESTLSAGVVTLTANASLSGETVILGNPFLAQLDFDELHDYNSSFIEPYYQVMNSDGVIESYHKGLPGTIGGPDQYIAPMQSVFVTSVSVFGNLYATPLMTASSPGNKLRNGTMVSPESLSVKLEREHQANRSTLFYHPQGEVGEEYRNVPQAFVDAITEPASVYFITDETLLDICHLSDLSEPVWLGLRTASTGKMKFRFEGLREFASGYDIYLTDLGGEIPVQTDLRVFPYYRFEKTEEDMFVHNRFYVSFINSPTSIPEELKPANQGIDIIKTKEGVKVISVDGSSLKDVVVYDLQGRNLMRQKDINSLVSEIYIPVKGIFLVKASSDTATRTMKFYN
ncbi:MAG: VCBS repeat-containing protein [Candidatus Azobacteroides sp.]|nr:VCBS repeat-containing protein [Candidatus Azobacteroides sp.]